MTTDSGKGLGRDSQTRQMKSSSELSEKRIWNKESTTETFVNEQRLLKDKSCFLSDGVI